MALRAPRLHAPARWGPWRADFRDGFGKGPWRREDIRGGGLWRREDIRGLTSLVVPRALSLQESRRDLHPLEHNQQIQLPGEAYVLPPACLPPGTARCQTRGITCLGA